MAQGLGENLAINIGVNVTGLPQVQHVQTRMNNLNKTIQRSTSQYNSNAVATNKWAKGALQQAGYQVGDFSVQVANGTSAIQAFGQQGSQLLGIFGPIGAVLGAGVAIVSAIALAFERSGKSAKSAKDSIEELADATSELHSLNQQSAASFATLRDEYGTLTDRARALLKIQREIAEVEAIQAFGQATTTIIESGLSGFDKLNEKLIRGGQEYRDIVEEIKATTLGNLISQRDEASEYNATLESSIAHYEEQITQIKSAQSNLKTLADFMGVSEEAAEGIAVALSDVSAAEGARAQAKAMADLAKSIYESTDGLKNSTEGARTLYAQLLQAAMQGLKLSGAIEDAEEPTARTAEAASVLATNLSAASMQAAQLSRNLSMAPSGLQAMRDQTAIMQAEIAAINAGYTQLAASSAAFRKEKEIEYGLADAANAAEEAYINSLIYRDIKAFEARERAKTQLGELRDKFNEVGTAGGAAMSKIKASTDGAADAAMRLRDALASVTTAAMTQQEKIAILTAKVAAAQRGGSAAYAEAATKTAIELSKAGASLDQIAAAADTAGQQAVKIEQLNEQFRELGQTGGGAMSKIKESTDNALGSLDKMFTELDATVGNISKTIEDSLTSGFMAMVDGTKTAKDAFRDMAKAIIAELYKVLVVQQLVGSVKEGTGLAGAIGSALGFSGARASGGQVTANKAYLVGERGPEMLVPSRNAHVIPNSKMGGGGPVQVVYQFQGGVTEADLGRALPLLVERTKREVVDAVQRGGSVARVFR